MSGATPHELVLQAAKDMLHQGLTEGTAGNISMRLEDGNVVVTPSSVDYDGMTLDDLVVLTPTGDVVSGHRPATSEKLLHLAVLEAYPDINSVIHSHAAFATMFAVAHQDIPPVIDEFTIYVGGAVRCSEYAPSGSAELGAAIVKALEGRGAALIANHGMVAVGPTPAKALHITALVDRVAQIVVGAHTLGTVHELPPEVNETFATIYPYMRSKA
jgi:L-fuculose-phosphate aldolase